MKLEAIIAKLESVFLLKDAVSWDFVGWQVKSKEKECEISSVLVALDITESVIKEAIKNNIKLIVVHHPFIFANRIEELANKQWKKYLQQQLKIHNINVYVLHTNFDSNINGMAFLIAKDLKLNKIKYYDQEKLSVSGEFNDIKLVKVVANVKKYFGFKKIKVISADLKTKINKVIVAPGAFGSIVERVTQHDNVSLIITGEMKWQHELEARDKKINVLILDHNMEEKFVDFVSEFLLKHVFQNHEVTIRRYFFQPANLI